MRNGAGRFGGGGGGYGGERGGGHGVWAGTLDGAKAYGGERPHAPQGSPGMPSDRIGGRTARLASPLDSAFAQAMLSPRQDLPRSPYDASWQDLNQSVRRTLSHIRQHPTAAPIPPEAARASEETTSSDSTSIPDSHAADADRMLAPTDHGNWGGGADSGADHGFHGVFRGGDGGVDEENEERRVDVTDGGAYTHAEFLDFYGEEGHECWEQSPRAAADQSAYDPPPLHMESGRGDRHWRDAVGHVEPHHEQVHSYSYRL